MLIKQKQQWGHYLGWGTVALMCLISGYGLLLKQKPEATVSAEVSLAQPSHLMLQVDTQTEIGLEYTLFGNPEVIQRTEVAETELTQVPAVFPRNLPHYPPPVVEQDYPQALVMALTYPWVPKPTTEQAQYTTFLLDSLPLPVVSLSGPPDYFFGEKGFYSVKSEHSKEIPHSIHFELIDTTARLIASVSAEATVSGISSKKLPMKSLDLSLDTPLFSNQVFGDTLEIPLHSIRLRNAGNDFLLAYMRDVVVSALSQSTHAIGLRYQPVTVFINGEFWGLQYLREHISEDNLQARHPDLARDQIRLGELHKNEVFVISNGFNYQMEHLMDFIERADLQQPELYDSLSQLMDLPNFIDYIAIQTFVSNSDWPHNNVKAVFLKDKLYFLLYDTDFAFAYPKHYREQVGNYFNWPDRIHDLQASTHNYFDSLDHYLPSQIGQIYRRLIEVPAFREQFITRYRELLRAPLSQSRIQQVVSSIQDQIAPLMPLHSARWGYPISVADWYQNVRQITDFCALRRLYINDQINALEDRAFPAILAADSVQNNERH